MFHVYTFGRKSVQFLILTPKQAKTMNDFTECFLRSQEHHLAEKGYRWDPTVDPTITMLIPDSDPNLMKRYNKLATFCNFQHKIRNWIFTILRIDVSKEDIDDDLIKRF